MSVKAQKNVIVAGGIIVALLAGTVLLGGYAKFSPAKSDSSVQAEGCSGCSMAQGAACGASLAENTEKPCAGQAMGAFNPETCPAGRTEPCCAESPSSSEDCCGKPCPTDCPKPCCAEQKAAGSCPMATQTADTK